MSLLATVEFALVPSLSIFPIIRAREPPMDLVCKSDTCTFLSFHF